MAEDVRKFKFISPGVFVNEIDKSQLPETPGAIGPLLIGTAQKGPMMRPTVINSYGDFVATFGDPLPGGMGGDAWRNGNQTAPTYAPYAAKAWLDSNAPITFTRLGGLQKSDATTAGYAGWQAGDISATNSAGGAWGIFVWPSSSIDAAAGVPISAQGGGPVTGALAAVVYCTEGRVVLSGTMVGEAGADQATGSACQLIRSDSKGNLKMLISSDGKDSALKTVEFNFNPNSKGFIRKVLNTNPTVTNSTITTAKTRTSAEGGNYWVGETYETALAQEGNASLGVLGKPDDSGAVLDTTFHAAILPLQNHLDTTEEVNDRRYGAQRATTGWYISQDTSTSAAAYVSTNMQKLFRFEALAPGESVQNEIKVSISNITYPSGDYNNYGTFSVLVRQISDSDRLPQIIERYDEVNLNPASANFIGKVIGDKFVEYNETDKAVREYGQYDNNSKFIRVVLNEELEAGALAADLIPFGVYGPVAYRPFSVISGSGAPTQMGAYTSGSFGLTTGGEVQTLAIGGNDAKFGSLGGNTNKLRSMLQLQPLNAAAAARLQFHGTVIFPSVPLRKQHSWGSPKNLRATYWGAWTGKSTSNVNYNDGIVDMLKNQCRGEQGNQASTTLDVGVSGSVGNATTSPLVTSWVFSLDDIVGSTDGVTYTYTSGSRASGTSVSAVSGSYTASLDAGLDRFTTLMHGGTSGLNLREKNAFRNALMNSTTEKTSSPLFSLRAAINMASDPEQLQYNVVSIPGVTQKLVTDYLLETVEERADSLAIIDLPLVYLPASDSNASQQTRRNYTVKQAVDDLESRNINNSYGAAYTPWVMVRDTNTNRTLWAPPSVAAIGALSTTDATSAPWFAPAGFTRGGLSEGAGGLPVIDVTRRLTADDRDDLYEANINPIAKFPAEGIVIFGQKTLQQTASALDRINVRRLLIFLKREISFMASRLLFDANVPATWTNFTSQAAPLLERVKSQFGIDDFRLVLDSTTTTPDLIDRNIIYAKLFIKPTRAAEYFAIDFIINRSGASFED
jgi:hypothetical protein